jgi:hypothetical protein
MVYSDFSGRLIFVEIFVNFNDKTDLRFYEQNIKS